MLILDEDGTCVDANTAARRLLGLEATGFAGRRIDEFAAPSVLGAKSRRWPIFLVEGHDEGECELVGAGGAQVWVEFTLTARIGSNRHLAVLRDVSARKGSDADRRSLGGVRWLAPQDDAPGSLARPAPVARRVLVVEDDPASRLVTLGLMQARGLEVDAAESGHDALAALEKATYDAIFMDCEMSGLDGYQTTREIRRREGSGRHTPIIAMTATSIAGGAERCHAAGMDFYVAKPIRPAGLDYIIAQSIGTPEA
jgi:PAS domain S-box-containing protein